MLEEGRFKNKNNTSIDASIDATTNRSWDRMHKFCEECVGKKCDIGTTIDLEVEELSDANNNNAEITNETHDVLYNDSDEVNIKIDNER